MEKAKKNAGDQTIKISDKIREVLTVEIKQASTNKISEVFEQANHELEDLVKFSSAPATEDKIPAGEPGISKAEGKNVVETEYFDKVADNGSKDEITISTINIEDETEPKHNFNGWLK